MTTEVSNMTGSPFSRRLVRRVGWIAIVAIIALVAKSSTFVVDETEFVIKEQLGQIVAVYDQPDDRGFHFKLPWPLGSVRRFDRRTQLFDPRGREMFTSDRKNITIDAYVCWRIAPPTKAEAARLADRPVVRFFQSLLNTDNARAHIDSRVRAVLSARIAQIEMSHLMNVDNSESGPRDDDIGLLQEISASVRQNVMQRVDLSGQFTESKSIRDRWGIEIVDVRIKRINFPAGNQQAVFERMKSERRKIADGYRLDGMAHNTEIKSQADRQYNEILARANADAERIRGEAEAEAITILNRAHAQDPEFYRVVRTLDSYEKILNERTTLVLSASSPLLKLLTEGVPELGPAPAIKKPSPTPVNRDRDTTEDVIPTKNSKAKKPQVATDAANPSPPPKATDSKNSSGGEL